MVVLIKKIIRLEWYCKLGTQIRMGKMRIEMWNGGAKSTVEGYFCPEDKTFVAMIQSQRG